MRLLDLFCGQGGAALGYQRAGFQVVGVDLADHGKRYPGHFHRGDALDFLLQHGRAFDAIHASPPCQGYSRATAGNPAARSKHRRLIAATRDLLQLTGRPWVRAAVNTCHVPDCGNTRCEVCDERMTCYGPEPAITCPAHPLCTDCEDGNNPCSECAYWKAAMAS